ncbi:hypothetical protein NDU88_001041 [Pleurodeles waltl]|uniref:Uncharacterized protein n=1 Tax=Pleurodeles waltl TaxID=8319 RepID=A0AAV7V6Q1_PLEWA|nr:hypothetical protein NDU88_001041 [Pleurodeles waltl]
MDSPLCPESDTTASGAAPAPSLPEPPTTPGPQRTALSLQPPAPAEGTGHNLGGPLERPRTGQGPSDPQRVPLGLQCLSRFECPRGRHALSG